MTKRYLFIPAICIIFFALWTLPAFSQVNTAWVRRYNGEGNTFDYGKAMAVDGFGNVYVTGLSCLWGSHYYYATIQYDPNGGIVWTTTHDNQWEGYYDQPLAIAVDGSGNIYVAGGNWSDISGADYVTIKYDADGNEIWVRRYDGPSSMYDWAYAVAPDDFGNVYVTGASTGDGGNSDYATVKYDADGNELWDRRYDGLGDYGDRARAVAVDGSGNINVTGMSSVDAGNWDYVTIKYAPNGDELWVRRYDGPANHWDEPSSIAADASGNVYVTGASAGEGPAGMGWDYASIKYGPSGSELWVRRYDGPGGDSDGASDIVVDGFGNVYVTGMSEGPQPNCSDYATIKYDVDGNELWVRRYDGPGNSGDSAAAVALDSDGNVYVTGYSWGTGTGLDYATVKYDPDGTQVWVKRYHNGPAEGYDIARAIALDGSDNVYVTGESYGGSTEDDYATIKYEQDGNVLFFDDFEDGYDDGWEHILGSCTWAVEDEEYATSLEGNKVWCISAAGNVNWTDYVFEADVYGMAGVDKVIAFRLQDENNFYAVNLRSDWMGLDEVTLNKMENGVLIADIARVEHPSQSNQWYHLKVIATGDQVAVCVDHHDDPVLDWTDEENPFLDGRVAVCGWTGDADINAVRFDNIVVRDSENQRPTALIDDISPNPAEEGEEVTFLGHGEDIDGSVVGYAWSSSIDGSLSDQASFSRSDLSVGDHIIYFQVQDDDGAWSEVVSEILEIRHKPFYFVHITDTHYGENGARAAVNSLIDEILTRDPKPAFVIVTGDILDLGWFSGDVPAILWPRREQENNDYSVFEADFQRLENNGIPYFVCPGNHDYYSYPLRTKDLSKYNDHFPITWESEFVENSLHIISINSGSDDLSESPFSPPKGNGLSASDLNWMEEILDALDGDPDNNCDLSPLKKVIIMHHPTINYLSGHTHGDFCLCYPIFPEWVLWCDRWDAGVIHHNRDQFKQLCDQYEVDVVCSGHIHSDRTYDASMDWSDWEGDQDGYDKAYCPDCPDPENYPLSTSDKTLYEYTGAAKYGAYRILWVESDGIMVHEANVLDDIIIATVFGCPATLHLYDSTGNHVGSNGGIGVDFEIEHATYSFMPIGDTVETDPTLWEHTEEEISIVCGADDFRYELNGTGDGALFFSVKKDMPGGSYIRLFYDSLTVTATSIGKLYIHAGSLDYTIYMDDDGDGVVDREIQPDIVSALLRGDANGDGMIDVGDIVYLVNFLYRNGDPPIPMESGDANCDGIVNVADVVCLVNYLYRGGDPPGCP